MADPFSLISGKLAEKLVDGAVSKVSSHITKQEATSKRIQSVRPELDKLKARCERIQALLRDAVQRRRIADDAVKLRLQHLKSVAFDIEDLSDQFQTQETIQKTRKRKRGDGFSSSAMLEFADRIDEINARYETINKDRESLYLNAQEASRVVAVEVRLPQECYLQDEAQIHGRQAEMQQILRVLLSDDGTTTGSGRSLPVVSINACTGLGKTVLARSVFNDVSVKGHFERRIWVGLEQGFDVVRTTEEIVKSVEEKECGLSSLNLVQYQLKKLLGSKRFLLVLDNVWNEDQFFWERLRAPFVGAAQGSRILITTRSERVSMNMQAVQSFPLNGLSDVDGWELFCSRAFPGAQPCEELDEIGRKIVTKCQGSPLAVKLIGGLLYNEKDEDKWGRVLDEMPENEAVKQNVMPSLKVSYDHLPLHLKHCLAFCSVFPNGYEFDKDELIRLWMALGFIVPRRRVRLENIGDDYFSGLMWRSFFQVSDGYRNQKQKYKMPSMVYDLAKSVSEIDCLRMDRGEVVQHDKINKAYYALVHQYDEQSVELEKIFENKGLRALILHGKNGLLPKQVLFSLFKKVRNLRVLSLSYSKVDELPDSFGDLILLRYVNLHSTRIAMLPESVGNLHNLQSLELGNCHELSKLPDSIGNLKHLRYLDLHSTKIKRLPESVCQLGSLHTLELGECYELQELPEGLSNLVSLKHLGLHLDWEVWDMGTDLISMPVGISKLTSLQTLSRFVVGSHGGCGIGELRNLKLRGELCISKLELVSPSEAKEAKLEGKHRIDTMMLRWSDGSCSKTLNAGKEEEVLKYLCPHKNLKQLWIYNYKGTSFPDWMVDHSFSNLDTLRLSNCRNCQALPTVGKLPQLRTLHLEGLDVVESMAHVFTSTEDVISFPHLERLFLTDMPLLQKFEVTGGDMARFSELTISNCSKLRELPYLPPTIAKLEIRDCLQLTTFPQLQSLQDLVIERCREDAITWIEKCTSLSSLTIFKVPLLDRVPRGLISLKTLKIQECQQFEPLDQNECLQSLTSLEHLEISSCPFFSFSPNQSLPAKLKEFRVANCSSITSWPKLDLLSSLQCIDIQNLPGLKSMPELPPNLQSLAISGCSMLQKRCQKDGADWQKVANIPFQKIESSGAKLLGGFFKRFL